MISKKLIENIVADYHANMKQVYSLKDWHYTNANRILGALEGILLCYGKLEAGKPFEYKEVKYDFKFLWIVKHKTRKQTYAEFILEKANELISEFTEQ